VRAERVSRRAASALLAAVPEQSWGQVAEVVPPVDPGVSAAADVQLVLDPVLLQQFRQGLRAGQGKVLVADADRKELDGLVDLLREPLLAILPGEWRARS
jgi:HEAT repeat protein